MNLKVKYLVLIIMFQINAIDKVLIWKEYDKIREKYEFELKIIDDLPSTEIVFIEYVRVFLI